MHYYETLVGARDSGLTTAQVLLTQADLDDRRNYLNVRNTLVTLFAEHGVHGCPKPLDAGADHGLGAVEKDVNGKAP